MAAARPNADAALLELTMAVSVVAPLLPRRFRDARGRLVRAAGAFVIAAQKGGQVNTVPSPPEALDNLRAAVDAAWKAGCSWHDVAALVNREALPDAEPGDDDMEAGHGE
ncbi:hypothetical protein [Nitrospirillum viridazoti]|uniref:Uncharacterized protein n=1 Tax=Nitrospirillum amazonense TaxID=28077 RepID=A0A560II33_9PROT|nr:hypothetical protein [Nitrospirillum amazonense]TWB58708.1 hypothetical protein FBZ92_109201 [Nitrospirillum amazonense]